MGPARKFGLEIGDVIIRLDDMDVTNTSLQMMDEVIMRSTKSLIACIVRGNIMDEVDNDNVLLNCLSDSVERHIAEVISGEAEILRDHNIIG